MKQRNPAVHAMDVPPSSKSSYPERFASMMAGRTKRRLGDVFALTGFGVNLTRLAPGAISALRHAHSTRDEFVYIISGSPTLVTNAGTHSLQSGACAGFRAGDGNAHQIRNDSQDEVYYIEIGDRRSGDIVNYPDDDLAAVLGKGGYRYLHKDGAPY